jgi:hypothetical protein
MSLVTVVVGAGLAWASAALLACLTLTALMIISGGEVVVDVLGEHYALVESTLQAA